VAEEDNSSAFETDKLISPLSDGIKSEDKHLMVEVKQESAVSEELDLYISHIVESKLDGYRKSEENEYSNQIDELEGVIKVETEPDIDEILTPVKKRIRIRNKTPVPVVAKACPICAKEVKYLNGHIKDVHTETPRIRTKTPVVAKVCPICAKEVKYLNGHIKDVHTETPAENHICNHCGKVFSKAKKLRGHIDAAHKVEPTMCDICSQVFKNPHALRGHRRKVHEQIGEVTCPSCFKVFENKLKLYDHERAVHTLQDSKCQACGKTYKNKNLLQKHVKVYHKDLYENQKNSSNN
jgi:hypothetical protein